MPRGEDEITALHQIIDGLGMLAQGGGDRRFKRNGFNETYCSSFGWNDGS